MININYEFFDNAQYKELEIASENLPNNLICRCQCDNSNDVNSDIYLFPHNNEEGIFTLEHHILSLGNVQNFGSLTYAPYNQKTNIFLNLEKIPDYYDFVEVYKFHHTDGEDLDFFVGENINNNPVRVLFGYTMIGIKNYPANIHIGTFGKTDSGWKFYPKMKDTKLSQLEILQKYFDEYH